MAQHAVYMYYVDMEGGVCIHFSAAFDILLWFLWYMHVAFYAPYMFLSL